MIDIETKRKHKRKRKWDQEKTNENDNDDDNNNNDNFDILSQYSSFESLWDERLQSKESSQRNFLRSSRRY